MMIPCYLYRENEGGCFGLDYGIVDRLIKSTGEHYSTLISYKS